MAHDIFISYAHEDKLLADALCATLERGGLRCWIAPRDVPPGNWGAAIVEAIEASRAFVLVFSSRSNTSGQVHREVERAVDKGLIVVPVRVQDVPLSKEMQYFISSQHWLDALTPPIEKQFEVVSEKLQAWLLKETGTTVGQTTSRTKMDHPQPVGSKLTKLLVAVLCGLAVLAGAVVFLMKKSPPGPASTFKVQPQSPETGVLKAPPASAPVFTGQPQDRESKEGSSSDFEGIAEGPGRLSYGWEFTSGNGPWVRIPSATDPKLHLPKIGLSQAGQYRLIASNQSGSVTSAPATLAVIPLRAPEITRLPPNREVRQGERTELAIDSAGDGPLAYAWQFKDGSDNWETIPNQGTDSLVVDPVRETRSYRVIVSSSAGSVTSAPMVVRIVLPQKPMIVRQPVGLDVSAGQEAVIEAEASGDGPLSFLWEFKGDNQDEWKRVSGASSARLVFSHASETNAGSYRLTVQNSAGSATSAEVELKVVPVKPQVIVQMRRLFLFNRDNLGQKLIDGIQQALLASGKFDVKITPAIRTIGNPSVITPYKITLNVDQFQLNMADKTPTGGSILGGIINLNGVGMVPYTFEPDINYKVSWQILSGTSLLKVGSTSGIVTGQTFKMPRRQNQKVTVVQAQNYAMNNNLVPGAEAVQQVIAELSKQIVDMQFPE